MCSPRGHEAGERAVAILFQGERPNTTEGFRVMLTMEAGASIDADTVVATLRILCLRADPERLVSERSRTSDGRGERSGLAELFRAARDDTGGVERLLGVVMFRMSTSRGF